jgi:galactokinase
MKTIVSRHKALCENSEPAVIVQAPIVCTLFGAFAEACLGYSLLSCGDLSITISVSKRKDNLVKVYKSNGVDKKRFALNALRFRKEISKSPN